MFISKGPYKEPLIMREPSPFSSNDQEILAVNYTFAKAYLEKQGFALDSTIHEGEWAGQGWVNTRQGRRAVILIRQWNIPRIEAIK